MKNAVNLTFIIFASFLFSSCNFKKNTDTQPIENSTQPLPSIEVTTTPTDPIELFLLELTKATNIPFSTPSKADIFWSEGDSISNRKTFFGNSYLINFQTPSIEDEKTIENYFKNNNFTYMKFNESRGEDSHKVGYRRDSLVCKYDWSKYPDESVPHLIVYCTDASKGTERK